MGILSPLGLPIPGHLQPYVDSAHPVIDLPVAEILKYIAADPRREVLGPGALPIPPRFQQRHSGISAQHRRSWTLALPRAAAPIGSAYCEDENILRPKRGLWYSRSLGFGIDEAYTKGANGVMPCSRWDPSMGAGGRWSGI